MIVRAEPMYLNIHQFVKVTKSLNSFAIGLHVKRKMGQEKRRHKKSPEKNHTGPKRALKANKEPSPINPLQIEPISIQ